MEAENINGENALSGKDAAGSKAEGSIFSQNLELDFQPAGRPPQAERKEDREEDINPAERTTYFQIEAGKVVDLLREELERFGDSARDLELVDDLWRSWQALWGNGGDRVQQEFGTLFDTARQALGAAARRESSTLAPPEKMALSRLLQGMDRLAAGRTGADDMKWCRETGNRVSRMVAAWISEGLGAEEERQDSQKGEMPDDISGSIDEWFSQVSKFIPQSPDDALDIAEQPPIRQDVSETAKLEVQAAEAVLEQHVSEEDVPADEPVSVPVETADDILAAAEQEGWEMAVPEKPDQNVAETERTSMVVESGSGAEDIVIEGTSEGWLAEIYFGECCLDVVEAIQNNIDRLEGSGAPRTASNLLDRVDYLVQLSEDFVLGELAGVLKSLRGQLVAISGTGRNDRSGDARRVEELLSTLGTLERECEECATPAW